MLIYSIVFVFTFLMHDNTVEHIVLYCRYKITLGNQLITIHDMLSCFVVYCMICSLIRACDIIIITTCCFQIWLDNMQFLPLVRMLSNQ